ncbi:hypothetical protein [Bacillus thuringiensis]|uniref:hypothetical protein n=1 Tax=Bacillus thuringiensis TaxID=1428 RepID=UPI000BF75BC1|nr:hypothetical protein [Bacillus thuringiensis]PFN47358.1 hypothetical protein COJ75_29565 [Bacillus thuringiensis]
MSKIEQIYQEILDGKRSRFPCYTWSDDQNNDLAKRVIKYLIEVVLKWDKRKILDNWKEEIIIKFKLGGVLNIKYHASPFAMINDVYPNYFKEWEFRKTPKNFWTKKKALEALKWTIEEKEHLTDNQLLDVYNIKWLSNQHLSSACQIFWGKSPFLMVNDLYPNRFKEWEFRKTPKNFWTKKKALEALKWTIEEKRKMVDTEIRENINVQWFTQNGLRTPLERYWNDSPFFMINELYPNRFKEWEFPMTPRNYWTKERALEALKWTIEEKEKLNNEQLTKLYSRNWLIKQGLRTPLERFWNNGPYAMLHDLYPERFKEWELNRVPKKYWTKEKALEALKWIIEEKRKMVDTEIRENINVQWFAQNGLSTPLRRYWNNSSFHMIDELYPGRFKDWEFRKKSRDYWTKERALEVLS